MRDNPLLYFKIVGAVMFTGLLGMGAKLISDTIYQTETLETHAFSISDSESEAPIKQQNIAAPRKPESISLLIASARASRGKKLFRACIACHTITNGGADKVGPNLWNVVGHSIASRKGYRYSAAFRKMEGRWDYESLDLFLFKPKLFAPGTKMTYTGMKAPEDRADVIAYVRSLSDNPEPLP